MTAVVLRGDARALPLPDACVDLIVTSPPYFGLRSYTDNVKCYDCIQMEYAGRDPRQAWPDYDAHVRDVHLRHYDGQIGSEASPREWLAALAECTAEWVRVLKPSGSIFVNLGDKYAGGGQGGNVGGNLNGGPHLNRTPANARNVPPGAREKSLLGLPWRYALACMDDLGLILRRDIIWSKPNGLPESVTDRCRSSHEYLFHFTVRPRYYAAVDEIREPQKFTGGGGHGNPALLRQEEASQGRRQFARNGRDVPLDYNPLGKLPGSVWDIPSQPLTVPAALGVDHFAAFPMELPRRCILGWSPPGICTDCWEGRRPVTDKAKLGGWRVGTTDVRQRGIGDQVGHGGEMVGAFHHRDVSVTITGYECACPAPLAPTVPAVVLDPFGGTGTTALVAAAYGRTGISVDMSGDYSRLARWRTTDPGERARALLVPKPPPVPDGQVSLFDDVEAM